LFRGHRQQATFERRKAVHRKVSLAPDSNIFFFKPWVKSWKRSRGKILHPKSRHLPPPFESLLKKPRIIFSFKIPFLDEFEEEEMEENEEEDGRVSAISGSEPVCCYEGTSRNGP
jgi:hypothetical protein